jgi:hypothetical protein
MPRTQRNTTDDALPAGARMVGLDITTGEEPDGRGRCVVMVTLATGERFGCQAPTIGEAIARVRAAIRGEAC